MRDEQALRLLVFQAVEGWLPSQPQLVHAALAKVLVGLAISSRPQKIIGEGEELVCKLADEILDFLNFSIGALGAADSN